MSITDSILLGAWVLLLLVILFSVSSIQAFESYFLRLPGISAGVISIDSLASGFYLTPYSTPIPVISALSP